MAFRILKISSTVTTTIRIIMTSMVAVNSQYNLIIPTTAPYIIITIATTTTTITTIALIIITIKTITKSKMIPRPKKTTVIWSTTTTTTTMIPRTVTFLANLLMQTCQMIRLRVNIKREFKFSCKIACGIC